MNGTQERIIAAAEAFTDASSPAEQTAALAELTYAVLDLKEQRRDVFATRVRAVTWGDDGVFAIEALG